MSKFKLIGAVALLVAITSVLTVQIVMSTPAGLKAGWERKSYPTFRPQVGVAGYLAATSANASIYVPGITLNDYIVMCVEVDSNANALGTAGLVNHTDSAYVWNTDTIRIGTAIGVNSDLLVMWNKAN